MNGNGADIQRAVERVEGKLSELADFVREQDRSYIERFSNLEKTQMACQLAVNYRLKATEEHRSLQEEKRGKAPVLWLGIISAITAIVSVLVQLLIRGIP